MDREEPGTAVQIFATSSEGPPMSVVPMSNEAEPGCIEMGEPLTVTSSYTLAKSGSC